MLSVLPAIIKKKVHTGQRYFPQHLALKESSILRNYDGNSNKTTDKAVC